MTALRSDLPPLPPRMARLPVDGRGYPVPWFVAWLDDQGRACPRGQGTPDFRVISGNAAAVAHREGGCWLCGERLGVYRTFVIGPMCAVNRTSSEPPSHLECAEFSARACPFLTRPSAHRRETRMPEGYQLPPGEMIRRNPGTTLLWTVKRYRIFRVGDGILDGILFDVGDPVRVRWFCQGRDATRAEVLESIDSGMEILRIEAAKDGCEGLAELTRRYEAVLPLLPPV